MEYNPDVTQPASEWIILNGELEENVWEEDFGDLAGGAQSTACAGFSEQNATAGDQPPPSVGFLVSGGLAGRGSSPAVGDAGLERMPPFRTSDT